MAKGPKGEKRPADANQRAVMVARIATGEIEDKVTAAAFLPSSVTMSSISPVAIRATMTARWFASAGRRSPFGPFAMPMV